MLFSGAWDSVGPYKCSFSPQYKCSFFFFGNGDTHAECRHRLKGKRDWGVWKGEGGQAVGGGTISPSVHMGLDLPLPWNSHECINCGCICAS